MWNSPDPSWGKLVSLGNHPRSIKIGLMSPPPPIFAGHLLRPLHDELVALLGGLQPADWACGTDVPGWPVRRVVAHLVDTMLRRLSLHRDGHRPPAPATAPATPIDSGPALLDFLNRLNTDWIVATDRLSPAVLIALLEQFGPDMAEFLASLPPDGDAHWPVAWAGESASRNWMDVGREYTERWHHQQQIRSAVGAPLLTEPRWLGPVIGLGALALPVSYAAVDAPVGTRVTVTVTGPAGGGWTLIKQPARWYLSAADGTTATTEVTLSEDEAWRVWYSARRPRGPAPAAVVRGDPALAIPCLTSRALMV